MADPNITDTDHPFTGLFFKTKNPHMSKINEQTAFDN